MEQLNETKLDISTEGTSGKRKSLIIFWSRMLGWLVTGCGAPIGVFAYKFGLFNVASYTEQVDEMGNIVHTSISLNGWGIVSCFIIGWTILQILKEVLDSFGNSYSLTKQCLNGIKTRIIPILTAFFICYFLSGVINQIMFCLATLALSQLVAIPLNPLPKWKYEKRGVEDYADVYESLIAFAKKRTAKDKE